MADSIHADKVFPYVGDHSVRHAFDDTPLQNAELARIGGLANEFEAEIVRDALDKEGIYAHVQSNRETAFDGIFIPQKSWGSLIVRMDQAEQALEVFRSVRATFDSPDPDEPSED